MAKGPRYIFRSTYLRRQIIQYHTAHGVFFVKYCSVLLQALTIEADEDLLFAVYDLAQVKGLSWEVAEETE